MLYVESGEPFAQGMCRFSRMVHTNSGSLNRIMLIVRVEGIETEAVVDTGGVYLFCSPQLCQDLNLDPADGFPTGPLLFRNFRIPGTLYEVFLDLLAEAGHSIQVKATAFVPQSGSHDALDLPTYLGFTGCLEGLRFAVDPETDSFYFGNLGQE